MLSDQQLEILSDVIRPLFQYLEQEVILDIARRIQKTMTYTRTAELMAMEMQRLGYAPNKIRSEALKALRADKAYQKAVEENTVAYKKEVKKLIDEIVEQAKQIGDEIISNAGDMSWIDDMSMWESAGKTLSDNSFLHDLQKAIAEQTLEEMINLTRTTGFKTMSGYEAIGNAYRNELDKAMIKLCTGTFSQEKVLNDVIHNLAQSGLRSIDYANGYSMQLDTAAKTALRTGCGQIAAKMMDENIARTKENLVYVSKHWGARNKGIGVENHELWQGQVYFIKPGENYSEEAKRIGQDRIMDIWYSTGYSPDGSHVNNPLGLHGYNCRHIHYVWFLGASSLPDEQPEPKPVTINGKTYDYYQMTQKMRSMERNIRALKKELVAREALKLPRTEIKAKISQKTREYEEFCRKCKVPERTTNLRVDGSVVDVTKTKAYKVYQNAVVEHEELPRKATKGSYGVNWPEIQSDRFRKCFEQLSDNKKTIDAIENRAKWALSNRDGKNTEELYAIDLENGEEVAKIINQNIPKAVQRTAGFTRRLNAADNQGRKILLLHNHPSNLPPSLSDINALLKNKNVVGITIGHGGSVYYYSRPMTEIPEIDYRVAMRHFKEYTDIEAMEKTMELLSKKYSFEFRKL